MTKQRLLIKGERLPYCEGKDPRPLVYEGCCIGKRTPGGYRITNSQ
jgi:hypothetical protein